MPKAEWLRRLARYRRPVASDFIASEGAAGGSASDGGGSL